MHNVADEDLGPCLVDARYGQGWDFRSPTLSAVRRVPSTAYSLNRKGQLASRFHSHRSQRERIVFQTLRDALPQFSSAPQAVLSHGPHFPPIGGSLTAKAKMRCAPRFSAVGKEAIHRNEDLAHVPLLLHPLMSAVVFPPLSAAATDYEAAFPKPTGSGRLLKIDWDRR